MRNFALSVLIMMLSLSYTVQAACPDISVAKAKSAINKVVRAYMDQKGLINKSEEFNLPEIKVSAVWELTEIRKYENQCLAVMSFCLSTMNEKNKITKDCSSNFNSFGLQPAKTISSNPSKWIAVDFSEVVKVPKSLVAIIGSNPLENSHGDLSYFYAELKGASAIDAMKSWVLKIPAAGFSGLAVRSGFKAVFDETKNSRDWQLEHVEYSLQRGVTAEFNPQVLDVQAFQLDGLDPSGAEGYWTGCQKPDSIRKNKQFDISKQCEVSPWAQAFIRDIKINF